jgi:hypothetical protein
LSATVAPVDHAVTTLPEIFWQAFLKRFAFCRLESLLKLSAGKVAIKPF